MQSSAFSDFLKSFEPKVSGKRISDLMLEGEFVDFMLSEPPPTKKQINKVLASVAKIKHRSDLRKRLRDSCRNPMAKEKKPAK
jgi:hypothetical protein